MKRMPILVITRDIKTLFTPYGLNPALLCGLSKNHKALVDDLPNYRPTISQIGFPTYIYIHIY